jgi:hypothetical protein
MRKLVFLLLFVAAIPAQARSFDQPELDALLAPVALYPDELVNHILVAAAYPGQVSEAAHGVPAQPHWHPSVGALIAYPELLARMAESPQWMHDLSQAYIYQQASVMVTVQSLRTLAAARGHLPEPQREVVYVRYYDPLVVYGPWWHVRRPVFWHPWHHQRVFVRPHPRPHRHHHAAPSRPVHVKPYVRVPESRRRPIINSTPQLRHKQRSFAGPQLGAPRARSGSRHIKPR